ncbi:MAG: MATE family efflux transporter [Anaerolineaceae bacterium]|nr:MATE family efflux transporter [Anaerolineaceae bacterium]
MRFNTEANRNYFHLLFTVAIPIVLQHFVRSALNLVSGLIIGQLGDVPVAGVGLANQVFFVLTLLLFGIATGCAIFTAQFWGKGDIKNLHRVTGICLLLSMGGGIIFFIVSLLNPEWVIGIYTRDPLVLASGGEFLRTMSPSFLMVAVSFAYSAILRSAGDVKTPLYTSIVAIGISTLLGYWLVFGKMGLPEMGAVGAAVGIVVGRAVETGLLVWIIYQRKSPAAASFREMLDFDFTYFKNVLTRALPVAFNELFWATGFTTFNVIYAHISTDAIAAVNISSTIENLAFVVFIGISDGTGIIIGNKIGAGKGDDAYGFGLRTYLLVLAGSIAMGGVVYLTAGNLLSLYKVSPLVHEYARKVLIIVSVTLWVKTSNMTMVVGILRAGGDTRFSFLLDTLSIWLVGVPMALMGAFVLHLPVYWVALMASSEELVKMAVALTRFNSRKWIYDLTTIAAANG